MLTEKLNAVIKDYPDFPKKGIIFKDISPIFHNPPLFEELLNKLSEVSFLHDSDALVAIDARGFILGSALSYLIKKPLILARKKNKLPGELIEKNYELEYGIDSLSIQKDAINKFERFTIIDDLLATGGTAKCVNDIIKSANKIVSGLIVIIELEFLDAKGKLPFPVYSELKF